MQYNVDAYIDVVMNELEDLGIAENTIVIAMADNGPMTHNPPPGLGMAETIFRGGKGDVTEGGIRVPAFAWWPGTIEGGQISGDIIHVTDLFTTFANLAGANNYLPTDRVVDGIDQTDLMLNGDTRGRRDYVFVYGGNKLGAVIKGDYKYHIPAAGGDGLDAAFYFLPADPREATPVMTHMLHHREQFDRMVIRHYLLKETFPDSPRAHGIPFTGIDNARPETRALWEAPEALKYLPYDYEAVNGYELPWTDPDTEY
jgi:arylsulfatase A-like enzyme